MIREGVSRIWDEGDFITMTMGFGGDTKGENEDRGTQSTATLRQNLERTQNECRPFRPRDNFPGGPVVLPSVD